MFEKRVNSLADKYLMMTNQDKKLTLAHLQNKEKKITDLYWIIFLIMLLGAGTQGWGETAGYASGIFSSDDILLMGLLFTLILPVEVAFARSSPKTAWLWAILITSLVALVPTCMLSLLTLVWFPFFASAECRIIAMKRLAGYPVFVDTQNNNQYNMTEAQYTAYMQKSFDDMDNPEEARKRDAQAMEKILNGEMTFDEFLGVKEKDGEMDYERNVIDISKLEKNESYNDNSLSAEAFFASVEDKGGKLSEQSSYKRPNVTMSDVIAVNKNGGNND